MTLRASEWRVFREARLEALRQDPQAFLSTYAETVARPDETWQERLRSVEEGRQWLFFARLAGAGPGAGGPDSSALGGSGAVDAGGPIVGMMGAFPSPHSAGAAEIYGVFVDHAYRGRGIAAKLMARLLEALRQAGFSRARLGVARSQAAAIALYEKFGFAVVGDEPGLTGYFMERDL